MLKQRHMDSAGFTHGSHSIRVRSFLCLCADVDLGMSCRPKDKNCATMGIFSLIFAWNFTPITGSANTVRRREKTVKAGSCSVGH